MQSALTVRPATDATVVLFPATWLHVMAGPARTSAEVFEAIPSAELAVNGPMYATATGPQYLLRDRSQGVAIPSTRPTEGATVWVDAEGRAVGAYGTPVPESAVVAVQGWPSLVVDGAITATNTGTNIERVRRVGIGATADGSVLIVGLVGTMVTLASRMRAEGALVAAYLDGGSAYDLNQAPDISHRLPGWILAAPPSSGARAGSGGGSGSSAGAVVLAVVALLLLGARRR